MDEPFKPEMLYTKIELEFCDVIKRFFFDDPNEEIIIQRKVSLTNFRLWSIFPKHQTRL